MIRRRDILRQAVGGLSATLIARTNAYAVTDPERFPSRYITLLVPWGPGGPPDSIARVVAFGLSETLGKPVIVDNRPGASTSIAATAVARAVPDGYTLMQVDMSFAVTPHIFSNIRVDPLKDFKPVGLSAKSEFVLIASPALSTPTIADFIKLAKTQQQAITIGHSGIGSTPHLAAITFIKATGINPLLVPYRTIAQATEDVLTGQISALFSAEAMAIGLANSGKIKVLGVTGDKHAAELPDVPTFKEAGIEMAGFENGSWYGIVAPANTPDDIISKLNAALTTIAKTAELKQKLAASGAELRVDTPQEFSDLIAAQYAYWKNTLRAAGVTPQEN